jgi:hypothetical protein
MSLVFHSQVPPLQRLSATGLQECIQHACCKLQDTHARIQFAFRWACISLLRTARNRKWQNFAFLSCCSNADVRNCQDPKLGFCLFFGERTSCCFELQKTTVRKCCLLKCTVLIHTVWCKVPDTHFRVLFALRWVYINLRGTAWHCKCENLRWGVAPATDISCVFHVIFGSEVLFAFLSFMFLDWLYPCSTASYVWLS